VKPAANRGVVSVQPWRAPDAQAGSYALGMLGLDERRLLYHLARDNYTGEGAVVELGAFCGASTCCLAAGLRDNPLAAGRSVDSFDNFIASEPYLVDFLRTQFRETVELGKSFEAIHRRSIAPFADRVRVHKGNLLDQTWPANDPIEILFVDVAKTLALSGKVLTEFFMRLIPGKSLVIQQDFYHPTAFYLPVVMHFLSDYFTIIEAGRDWSVVFKLETAIPREKLEVARRYAFSFVEQHGALRRMMRRVGMPGRDYLLLSECAAIGTTFGEAQFRTALDHAIRRSSLEADHVWLDGLNWCKDFNASRIRTRLYGAPALMPPPTFADEAYLKVLAKISAIVDRVATR
jgi:Methyltransferase domain